MRKLALIPGLVAVAATAAACAANTTAASAPAAPTVSATAAPTVSATTVPATAPATTAATSAPTSPAAGSDVQVSATWDWRTQLSHCPDPGQQTQVQKVVTADVTGDHVPDLVVVRTCATSTAYWPSTVDVLDGAHHKRIATLLTTVGAADMPWVYSTAVSGHDITLSAYGVGPESAMACADHRFTYRYELTGGAFKLVSRTDKKVTACGVIN